MSGFDNSAVSSATLDAILDEIKSKKTEKTSAGPSGAARTWSMDDIDRLIADTGKDKAAKPLYNPPKPMAEPPAPPRAFEPSPVAQESGLSRFLSSEFDSSIFTVEAPAPELPRPLPDVFSDSRQLLPEVEGQETFFEPIVSEPEVFEIETVVVPDEAPPVPAEQKYIFDKTAPAAPPEKPRPIINEFPEDESSALEFFRTKSGAERKPAAVSADGTSEFRARFFNKLRLERTAEVDDSLEGPVDKSGIIVERKPSEDAQPGDLQPLPKIVAAEDMLQGGGDYDGKTIIVGTEKEPVLKPKKEDDKVDGQIVLTGFDEPHQEAEPVTADEVDIEQALWEKRRQKAKSFKIVDAPPIENLDEPEHTYEAEEQEQKERKKENRRHLEDENPPDDSPAGEYTMSAERIAVHSRLNRAVKKASAALIVNLIGEVLFLLMFFLPRIVEALSYKSVVFADGSLFMLSANAALLIILTVINNESFIDGFTKLINKKPDADSAASLCVAVALVQTVICAVAGNGASSAPIFTASAAFAMVIATLTRKTVAARILENFEVCAYKKEHSLYAIHRFDNEAEIFELGRGLLMGNAELLYSSKVGFPSDFLKNSDSCSVQEKTAKILIPAAAAGAAVSAVLTGVFTKDVYLALAAFAGTFCICSPVLSALCPEWITRRSNITLNAAGSMIVSIDAAEKTVQANAVVIDSADIFDRSNCAMHGMKDFKNIRIDDVLLYAAALVIKSGGPLRESFEQVVSNRQDLLPPVKELVYEDKLGIAARIHGQKVLLGNRSLLTNHNIEVPDKSVEDKYTHSGRKVMYLAVAGKLAALFVVSYAVDESLRPYLKELESNGTQVLVRTNDVNVTEELISHAFDMPKQSIHILSSVAGRLFKRRRDAVTDRLPVRVMHDGTAYSMLRTVAAAGRMNAASRLGSAAQIAAAAIGFAGMAVLGGLGLSEYFNGFTAVLFSVAATAAVLGVTSIKRIK